MEEEIKEEQPVIEQANVADETSDKSAASLTGSSQEKGFGKFKSAEALLEAYKALEAEFTRKSQQLSELEKEKAEAATVNEQKVVDELNMFLSKNSDAKPYADQLKAKSLAEGGRVDFDNIYAGVMVENLASGASKLDNPIVKKYVVQDDELRNYVIETYMQNLKQNQPPYLISGDKGEKVTGQKPATPMSLKDAKKMVEEMFS